MDGKSCAWDEDDLVTAGEYSEIFGLGGDESDGSKFKGGHFILEMFSSVCVLTDIEFDEWDCGQLMHFGFRVQSVEECPADAHLDQVSCPRQEVCECPNLWHLKQRKGFGISDSENTPLQELSVLCGLMVTGESRKDLASIGTTLFVKWSLFLLVGHRIVTVLPI
ncbi:hypothetical protein TNCV_3931131 [Trichonephila clavipes]|nr:hypothetical protein TNCV_3931131 [Trichonephila clavipes]